MKNENQTGSETNYTLFNVTATNGTVEVREGTVYIFL